MRYAAGAALFVALALCAGGGTVAAADATGTGPALAERLTTTGIRR